MLPILYHDASIIAVAKPSGMVVHRSAMARDPENCVRLLRRQVGANVYPAHRLDRGTSGVLLFSFNPETARTVWQAFVDRTVHKSYLAVVRGYAPESGDIDHPLADEKYDMPSPARTLFRSIAQVECPYPVGKYDTARYSLVRVSPLTGRTHQIRRHMKHIAHPVVGDTIYGEGRQNRLFRERFDLHRMLLHAESLRLPHPADGREIRIDAPLPAEMERIFEKFGWPRGRELREIDDSSDRRYFQPKE